MGATETRRLGDFPLFDWLRFAMASLVVLSHTGVFTWSFAGNLGVQVFFALSGWLIGTILIEMSERRLDLFYFNRATRIWLPYLAAMLLIYGLSAVRDPVAARWFEFLAYDATFTHNWFSLLPDPITALRQMPLQGTGNHFWSLAVEEQFYLAAPPIILLLPFGRNPWLWVGIAVAMTALGTNYGGISFGVAAAAFRHVHPGYVTDGRTRVIAAVVAVVTAPLLLLEAAYFYAVPVFSVATVLALAANGRRSALGKLAGGISFPLYLNGWAATFVLHGLFKHFGVAPGVGPGFIEYAGGVVVGAIAYFAIDRPVLANRQAWFTPARGKGLAIAAYVLVAAGTAIGLTLHGFPGLG